MATRYGGRSYGDRPQRYGLRDEGERYAGEDEWRGTSGTGRGYTEGDWESARDYSRQREGRYGWRGGYDTERTYGDTPSGYSPRSNYPSDYPSRDVSNYESGRGYNYGRGRFGTGSAYEYDEPGRYGSRGGERGWWDRASDEVASWFGDEEAERRRRMDEQRERLRGRGPKGYRRSDERIKEDVNDRLSDGYLDASDVEVNVQNAEVTLTGTVNSRRDKRMAEDIADAVTGVMNVENRLRVKAFGSENYSVPSTTETTTPTTTSSAAAGTTRTRS
jgi:osmotically-inducible protein OsmY